MASQIPVLSKSRFMAGLQCPKRLYLECHAPELAPPLGPVAQAILDAGNTVGAVARRRFPGGVLMDEPHFELEVERTRAALENPTVPSIYEAALKHHNIRIRADVLVRRRKEWWELVEVKSTTSVKPEHEWDVAIQLHVLEGAGIRIRRCSLMHLDRSYIHRGGDYDLEHLFLLEDLTKPARERQGEVRKALAEMRRTLRATDPPDVALGQHCKEPYTCPFHEHCHEGLPKDPFAVLPRLTQRLRSRIADAGIGRLEELPLDFKGLSPLQRRALEALRSGERFVDPAVRKVLGEVRFPVHFLDFETFAPPLPLYAGTRPYGVIPFQWSDHVLHEGGKVEHREFLHDGEGDPRPNFAARLLEATKGAGSVVVYSNFEDQRLAELEVVLPDLAKDLRKLRTRLFDLLPVVRRHVYDPGFGGSFSIKAVLPALIPGLGYDDLEICEGSLASIAFGEILSPDTLPERREFLRVNLLAYCRRDTEAMLELWRALK